MQKSRRPSEAELTGLFQLVESITGIGKDVILTRRTEATVIPRCLICDYLYRKGYSEEVIGSIIRRDHSTVNHCKQTFSNRLNQRGYEDYFRSWMVFKQKSYLINKYYE